MRERVFRCVLWGVCSAVIAVTATPSFAWISWVEPSLQGVMQVGDDPDETFHELIGKGWHFRRIQLPGD